jgi:hypothetical protein
VKGLQLNFGPGMLKSHKVRCDKRDAPARADCFGRLCSERFANGKVWLRFNLRGRFKVTETENTPSRGYRQ